MMASRRRHTRPTTWRRIGAVSERRGGIGDDRPNRVPEYVNTGSCDRRFEPAEMPGLWQRPADRRAVPVQPSRPYRPCLVMRRLRYRVRHLDQACGSVIRRRKVLPTGLSRLRKFPRIAASMASRARANSCGQVAKAVGTGNNHDQRGVCIHYRGTVHKEEPHASNV